jgi:hypothetical protein
MSAHQMTRGWLVGLLVLALPVTVAAHGEEHGGARQVVAGRISVQGFDIELITAPGMLQVHRAGEVMLRIRRGGAEEPDPHAGHAAHGAPGMPVGLPVIGADVRMTIAPAGSTGNAVRVVERGSPGTYPLAFEPTAAGPLRVRAEIGNVGRRPIAPAIVVDFGVEVADAAAWPWWPVSAVVVIAGLALAGIWLGAARSADAPLDFLALPRLTRVLTSPVLKPALQLPVLVMTGAVVFLGLVDMQDAGTNVAPRLTWTIWWAGVIFTLVLAGRVWCVVCPFGALNEWTAAVTGAWRRLPRVFRNLWWGIAAFMLLTWADEQLGVVRRPSVTAWLVIAIAAAAVVVGLRYERRSFCRYLCPIGGVLGLYAMTAPLELRAKDAAVCRGHRDKTCYRGTAQTSGCPMLQFPHALDRNNYCTFCLECARGCEHHNLALRVRSFGRDLWASSRRALDEAYLAVTLVGLTLILTARMLPAWSEWMTALGGALPATVRNAMTPAVYGTALESTVLLAGSLVITPLLLLGAAAIANRLAGSGGVGVRRTFVGFAYMFVPVALALHLAHNLSHLLLEGPAIVPAVQRAVALYTPWTLGEPNWRIAALAGAPVVSMLQMLVIVGFFLVSLLAGHRLSLSVYTDRHVAGRAVVPFVLLALLFMAAGIVLLGQPMAMRHTM